MEKTDEELNPVQYPEGRDIVWFAKEQERIEGILWEHSRMNREEIRRFGRKLFDWAVELQDIIDEIQEIVVKSRAYEYNYDNSTLVSRSGNTFTLYSGSSFLNLFKEDFLKNLFDARNHDYYKILQYLEQSHIQTARTYLALFREKGTIEVSSKSDGGWGFGVTE